jgi:lipoic acid synthetase
MDVARKLPVWLKRPLGCGKTYGQTENLISTLGLETICTNANCPNRGDCWSRGTATVLILGNVCTRGCKFCSVQKGQPQTPETDEPERIARLAGELKIKYLVITSVTRDDLPDGGAGQFRDCMNEVRRQYPQTRFEILTPDFRGCQRNALTILAEAMPFVFGHNIETVPSLYETARRGADFQRSLNLLKTAKEILGNVQTKSSIMLGLGETDSEVEQALKDLRSIGCDRITIGQYLKPASDCLDVVEYVTPEKFQQWGQRARQIGFKWVMSGPFVRSSYFAEQENTL